MSASRRTACATRVSLPRTRETRNASSIGMKYFELRREFMHGDRGKRCATAVQQSFLLAVSTLGGSLEESKGVIATGKTLWRAGKMKSDREMSFCEAKHRD